MEHDWCAEGGSYSFEPPGNIHTLEVPECVSEMCTLCHVLGAYIYVDPDGEVLSVEDIFIKLGFAREHYAKNGLGANFVDQFIW